MMSPHELTRDISMNKWNHGFIGDMDQTFPWFFCSAMLSSLLAIIHFLTIQLTQLTLFFLLAFRFLFQRLVTCICFGKNNEKNRSGRSGHVCMVPFKRVKLRFLQKMFFPARVWPKQPDSTDECLAKHLRMFFQVDIITGIILSSTYK